MSCLASYVQSTVEWVACVSVLHSNYVTPSVCIMSPAVLLPC